MTAPTAGRWSWSMDDDGVITIYAGPDGSRVEVAEVWRGPLRRRLGMEPMADASARAEQIANADAICAAMNVQRPGGDGDLVERLRAACNGHPSAKVPWPHRLLHDAANEIQALRQAAFGKEPRS